MPRGLFGRRARLPDKQVFTPPPPPPTFPFPMEYTGPTLPMPGMTQQAQRVHPSLFGEMDLPFAGGDQAPAGLLGPARGVEPPNAPQGMTQADMDSQAAREAIQRAQLAIQNEGYPTFNDPAYQQSGQAMAAAIDQNRAAVAEMERRQSIPWAEWWRRRGRQDANHPITAEDQNLLTRYRSGPVPRYERAESRRPGPR